MTESNHFHKEENIVRMDSKPSVDPRHFLTGGIVREEATSAFLATLLDQSVEFRTAFLSKCGIPQFTLREVYVEQKCRDVTLVGDGVAVIIENKIDAAAKKESGKQLLGYYRRLKKEQPSSQVHCVYLAPTSKDGEVEISNVCKVASEGEVGVAISWKDVEPMCKRLDDFDTLFAEQGIKHISDLILKRKQTSPTSYSDIQQKLKLVCKEVEVTIKDWNPNLDVRAIKGGTDKSYDLWYYSVMCALVKVEVTEFDDHNASCILLYGFNPNTNSNRFSKAESSKAKAWFLMVQKNNGGKYAFDADDGSMRRAVPFVGSWDELHDELFNDFSEMVSFIDNGVSEHRES